MSDKDKAKDLWRKLLTRTTDRGATPAEAMQAADLAARMAEKYGFDQSQKTFNAAVKPKLKSLPDWHRSLSFAIVKRFAISKRHNGAKTIFQGPEHLASVAAWLFAAVVSDINKQSRRAGVCQGYSGNGLRYFRIQFSEMAVHQLKYRLQPGFAEEMESYRDQFRESGYFKSEKWKKRARKIERIENKYADAISAGIKCGDEIPIDTNVVGGKEVRRIEQHCS